MKTIARGAFIVMTQVIALVASAQTYQITQTEFGDPKFSDKDIHPQNIILRDPAQVRAEVEFQRSDRRKTFQLYVGKMKDGKRAMHFEQPPGLDRTGPPGRRVMIFDGEICLATRGYGAELISADRAAYLSTPFAQLLILSNWRGQPIRIDEQGLLVRESKTGVQTVIVWRPERNQLEFKEFSGADVLMKLMIEGNTSRDRTRGEWTLQAFGRKIRRFEFKMVDPKPRIFPENIIPFGTKIFDLRENGSGGVVARWAGEWPKNLPQVEAKENSQAAASPGWMALQGVAAVLGVGLLIAGGRQLVRRD
ncbi:MAG TPA: hypothetical protein PLO61_04305 [Fimbriimonadaceae bacterium]|nr:hypothetical protein [Fimbriimonadaceae bacterium]HRJ32817.1 hypothetical protein [Fimbriimonadaceae bacterium]